MNVVEAQADISSRHRDLARRLAAPVVVVLTTAAAYLVYGHGFPNVDGMYSLLWGQALARGRLPDFTGGPTPHPLTNLVGLVLSPLGSRAPGALLALSYLSAGLLVWATWLVGSRLFGAVAGVVAALLIFSRDVVTYNTATVLLDMPYAALVILAIAMEAKQPRRGRSVLVILAVAGTLRPEAWLLSAAYWLWLLPAGDRASALRMGLLAATAPAVWLLSDLALTGDPLFSFVGTTEAASRLSGVPAGAHDLLTEGPVLLASTIRRVVVTVAVVGLAVGLAPHPAKEGSHGGCGGGSGDACLRDPGGCRRSCEHSVCDPHRGDDLRLRGRRGGRLAAGSP